MSQHFKRHANERLGSWRLVEPLGPGGNAEVWKAVGNDDVVALKILNTKNPQSEPFKRFKAEIDILRRLGERPGLVPLIDVSLPEKPTLKNPAWLAMPVATPIRNALGRTPSLELVVEAVADIATTLASLASEGISHRDIKPDNLYKYGGRWAVGDFGLVSYPDKEALTEEGRKLGPLHYLAPEMLANPTTAAGGPADVYSLAKTLWVLATGQTYPPPGQQRVEVPTLILGAYVSHGRTPLLDRLIENATAYDPDSRPSMAEMATELCSWSSSPRVAPSSMDLTDLSVRIAAAATPQRRIEEQRRKLVNEHEKLIRSLMPILKPLENRISSTLGLGQIGFRLHTDLLNALSEHREKASGLAGSQLRNIPAFTGLAANIRAQIPGNDHILLLSGIGATAYEDGVTVLEAAHIVQSNCPNQDSCPAGMTWLGNVASEVIWSRTDSSRIGSAHIEHVCVELANGLMNNLRSAIERFTALLESSR